jgi:hypothetical protein
VSAARTVQSCDAFVGLLFESRYKCMVCRVAHVLRNRVRKMQLSQRVSAK